MFFQSPEVAFKFVFILFLVTAYRVAVMESRMVNFWCPVGRYPDAEENCQICFAFCGRDGCTGPESYIGYGGCNSCWKGREVNDSHIVCTSPFLSSCDEGFFLHIVPRHHPSPMAGNVLCKRCHPLCQTCSGPGPSYCTRCRYFKLHNLCVDLCPRGTQTDYASKRCIDDSGNPRKRLIQTLIRNSRRHIVRQERDLIES